MRVSLRGSGAHIISFLSRNIEDKVLNIESITEQNRWHQILSKIQGSAGTGITYITSMDLQLCNIRRNSQGIDLNLNVPNKLNLVYVNTSCTES